MDGLPQRELVLRGFGDDVLLVRCRVRPVLASALHRCVAQSLRADPRGRRRSQPALEQVFGQRGDLQTRAVDMAIAVLRKQLEAGPVRRPPPRALYAAGLLTVLLGALLVAWFVSGWADVRTRQRSVREAPGVAATQRGAELSHELRGELAALISRETDRPYFHYQNLFHDPRASAGPSVAPSPLAGGPDDALVLGYFQLDAGGRTTTPTLNDELPERSEPKHLADNRRFRDEVTRSLAAALAPRTTGPLAWRTLGFAGQPAVVAVRQVETPDGRLVQGFVIDRTELTSWLATHAGDAVAELRTGDDGTTEIVPGWHLDVAANPRALVAAALEATAVARGFVLRFVAVGVIAILAAWLVVMLITRAERIAQERGQFAAAAAHELCTPLAGLQLYGDMLADGLGDPGKMRDHARRMSEEASRLGRVVSNVLGFSQLERGTLSVAPRAGALGDALRELAERAQPMLDRAGAVLALDVAPELSATFDRDALARIVGNLLDNAEKYGRQAADRTVTLAARGAGSTVEVVVTDHGPGITPAARARLFQPFARGVTSDGPAGLGLGLALSRSLARAMGGELVYRPVTGGGAAFVLTLARGSPAAA